MKNMRAVGMLAASLVLGLIVTVFAVMFVSGKGGSTDKVVVASMDIQMGSKLTPEMLTTVEWPAGAKPQGVFNDLKKLEGRVIKSSITRGEALLDSKLAPEGTQGGLSAVIAEGKRAMTVRVNDVVGVAGFALPGNYVDVMVNVKRDTNGVEKELSKTVLERVLVLAIAQEANRDETKPKVVNAVTLELSPDDAEKLDLARNVGNLTLVLRNQVDKATADTNGVTKKDLFNEPAPVVQPVKHVVKVVRTEKPVVAAVAPVEKTNCVDVLQNGVRTLSCF